MRRSEIAKIGNIANIDWVIGGILGGTAGAQRRAVSNPQAAELKRGSRQFAIDVIRLVRRFPRSVEAYVVARQLVKSATSTGANYRAACRARTPDEFAAKIGLVAEEADESEFWLDLVGASGVLRAADVRSLLLEAGELTAIFTASLDTAKRNIEARKNEIVGILAMLIVLGIWAIKWL